MPRKPRVFIEGGIYHVYCRASRGEAVFADDTEASEFKETLRRIKERDGLAERLRILDDVLRKEGETNGKLAL